MGRLSRYEQEPIPTSRVEEAALPREDLLLPEPEIVGYIPERTMEALIEAVGADGNTFMAFEHDEVELSPSPLYPKDPPIPNFSHVFNVVAHHLTSLDVIESTDMQPAAHKVRVYSHDYQESSLEKRIKDMILPYWDADYLYKDAALAVSSHDSIDFLVGNIDPEDPDLIEWFEQTHIEANAKVITRQQVLQTGRLRKLSDHHLRKKGLKIVTVPPCEIVYFNRRHIIRRRMKREPGTAFIQLDLREVSEQ